MVQRKIKFSCESNKHAKGGHTQYRRICVEVVDTLLLEKATSDQTSLVFVDGMIGVEFLAEDPLAADEVVMGRPWNNIPGVGFQKKVKLVVNSLLPIRSFWGR